MPTLDKINLGFAALAVLVLTGCDQRYVRRDEFNATVSELRSEDARQTAQADQIRVAMDERIGDHEVKLAELREGRVRVDTAMHFAPNQTELAQKDREALDDFARVVSQRGPNVLVTVEGFTDSAGPRAYNKRLGKARAENVRQYLIKAGLRRGQVRAISYGEDPQRQVLTHASPDKAFLNRRVALVVEYVPEDSIPAHARFAGTAIRENAQSARLEP